MSAPETCKNQHPGSPQRRKHDWELKPGTGEGSATALGRLKRIEHAKAQWFQVRASPELEANTDNSRKPSA